MQIFLQILSIIGIVILCILGLLLFLIALILFVPIRYKVTGSKNGKEFHLLVKASYLLHILTFRYELPEPGKGFLRLFGIKIKTFPEESQENENTKDTEHAEVQNVENTTENAALVNDEDTHSQTVGESDKIESISSKGKKPSDENDKKESEKPTKEKISIKDKLRKCIYTIKSFYGKIKSGKEKVSYYIRVLTAPENKKLCGRVLEHVLRILKSIRPRKLKANLQVGTGSPDTTGYVCALYGMLSPTLFKDVVLDADFEEAIFEGDFFAKGRITVFVLLVNAIKIITDKQLKVFLSELKREDK